MSADWLNYHHLYYFWTVAREGSIAAATVRLGLAQPTISAQLRSLEKAFGQRLFVRQGRNLTLTEAGRAVFRYAEEIFALGRELSQAMRGAPATIGDRPRRLAIGISDALPKLTTFRLLEPALRFDPPFRFRIRSDKAERLLQELSVHSLDLVLTDAPMPPSVKVRAYNHLLGECDVTVFGRADLAARYRPDFPRSLHGAPFLLPTPDTALRHSLDDWFRAAGPEPQVVGEVEDLAILQVLGRHGMGLFAAPSVVTDEIRRQYEVEVVGVLPAVRERFYAISIERRLTHPAVVAIRESARNRLRSPAE